jgi:hypothetical protein
MRLGLGLLVGVTAVLALPLQADEKARPLREAKSENGRFVLQVEAGSTGRGGRSCRATLCEQSGPNALARRCWQRALVNDTAPAYACVRNDGRYVVTLDEYGRGGARHALVIYGGNGELLRHFRLTDLLSKSTLHRVRAQAHRVAWLDKPRLVFDEAANQFVVQSGLGAEVRVDLRTLEIVRPGQNGGAALEGVPRAVQAVLLADDGADGAAEIAARLEQLKRERPHVSDDTALAADTAPAPVMIEPNEATAAPGPSPDDGVAPPDDPNAAPQDDVPAAEAGSVVQN